MQYSNHQSISNTRDVIKASLTVLTILLIMPILGNFPMLKSALPAFFVVWICVLAYTLMGGADEMSINLGHGYLEILSSRFIKTTRHRTVVISARDTDLISVKYYRFAFIRIASIKHMDHLGRTKTTRICLSNVEHAKRSEFIKELSQICKSNNTNK